jgi:hypothetical protein
MTKSTRPSAKAESVLALSNSWSPTSSMAMCTVTVVTASSGLAVMLAASPAAMTTIMVSPSAREKARIAAATMPGSAAGSTTRRIVSARVAPRERLPSRRLMGTARITSSEREETLGMIMIPITRPAASALCAATSRPSAVPMSRTSGATVSMAKKP